MTDDWQPPDHPLLPGLDEPLPLDVVEGLAATGGGLPYPLASDPVAQGAAAIQALAQALNTPFGTLPLLTAAGGLRMPAYEGEWALITFATATWRCDLPAYGLAYGSVSLRQWIFASGPVVLSHTTPGAQAINPAGVAIVDPDAYIWIAGGTPGALGVMLDAIQTCGFDGSLDPVIWYNASTQGLSMHGASPGRVSVYRKPEQVTGNVAAGYNAATAHTVDYRSLVVRIYWIQL